MDSVVGAIIIGAIIIAFAINSLKSSGNDNENEYPSYEPDYKKSAIENGLKMGLNSTEIFEKNKYTFKSEEEVNKYIKEYGFDEKFKELEELRKKNPNLKLEIEIDNLTEEITKLKKDIEELKEDLALAKETHNYDQARTDQDLIKFDKKSLGENMNRLKELKSLLKEKKNV